MPVLSQPLLTAGNVATQSVVNVRLHSATQSAAKVDINATSPTLGQGDTADQASSNLTNQLIQTQDLLSQTVVTQPAPAFTLPQAESQPQKKQRTDETLPNLQHEDETAMWMRKILKDPEFPEYCRSVESVLEKFFA